MKSIDSDDIDPEDWLQDYGGEPLPPSLDYTNTEVIGLPEGSYEADLSNVGNPSIINELVASKNNKKTERDEKRDWIESFTPKVTGRNRNEIREALLKAAAGDAEDTTGIWLVFNDMVGKGAFP